MSKPTRQVLGDPPESLKSVMLIDGITYTCDDIKKLEKLVTKLEEENHRLLLARNQKGEELGKLRREIQRLIKGTAYNTDIL